MDAPSRCPRCSSDEGIRISSTARPALGFWRRLEPVGWPLAIMCLAEAPEWLCVACEHEWREEEEESGPL